MGSLLSKSPTDIPPLNGKIAIVTGGNAGLGFATIQHLARLGAKVYMGARSKEKAKAAIELLKVEGLAPGNGEIVWLDLDLSNPRRAKNAAEAFLNKEKRLDILINNAAMILTPYAKSHDGIQDVMMINHIGHFVFTKTLLPLMTETAKLPGSDVRIVNVSSAGHSFLDAGVRFRNVDDFNIEFKDALLPSFSRYCLSKLAVILHAKELQRRLDVEDIPIMVISLNPGAVDTDNNRKYAAQYGLLLRPIFTWISKIFFASPSKAAYTPVFAAAAPVVRDQLTTYKGAYLEPGGKLGHKESKDARDAQLAGELWETTEMILADIGV